MNNWKEIEESQAHIKATSSGKEICPYRNGTTSENWNQQTDTKLVLGTFKTEVILGKMRVELESFEKLIIPIR